MLCQALWVLMLFLLLKSGSSREKLGAIGQVSSTKPSSLDSGPSSDHSQDVGARSEVRSGK